MRIRLTHHDIAIHGIDFASKVSGHYTRRDARRPHEECECRRVVLAEYAASLEKELVHGVTRERWRFERIQKGLLAKHAQRAHDDIAIVAALRAPLRGQRARTGRGIRWQARGETQRAGRFVDTDAILR